ncbi:MAG TPA: peptidoglycan DD-metalloendopeptidase family protein [Pyrinomonadaceae bacterium]|jgi:murein DD-endopeptidase MepM/ murein hydrolase activator NlpD
MDSDREVSKVTGGDAGPPRAGSDPRFDEETRQSARAVVPLDAGVRAAGPSPAARQIARQRALILILFLVVLALVAALVWALNSRYGATPVTPITQPPPTVEPTATPTPAPSASPSPSASPTVEASPVVSPSPAAGASPGLGPSPSASPAASVSPQAAPPPAPTPASNTNTNAGGQLLIPVAGVRAEQLTDTYTQARSEGRVHNAIDIMAAKGTPVLAAADGTVVRLFQSAKGGTTLYVRGTDDRTIYYYAHLDRYADGITENKPVRRGDVIAYVGDTGNAGAGNFHLHFAIWTTDDPKRYFDGANVNPYPLLAGKK